MSADRALSLVHFFPSFSYGGQQRRLATLIEALGPAVTHRIYALDGDVAAAPLIERHSQASLAPLALKKSSLVSLTNVRRLAGAIEESGADLLCTYNFGSIEAAIANRLGPNLPHVHHEDGFGRDEAQARNKKRAFARRRLLGKARVVVPSLGLERIAVNEWGVARERLVRIAPGIDIDRFRRPLRVDHAPVVVGSLGSLRAEKNHLRLIRCFVRAAAGRDARLVICGEGAERAALEHAIAHSAARDRINLSGATETPDAALAEFDIYAVSSDTEQTPLGMMEAMASGLPVLATNVGDIAAMLGDAADNNVFAPVDEEGFAARLATLIDNAAERVALGEKNAARAAGFDQRAMIEAFRALYFNAAA